MAIIWEYLEKAYPLAEGELDALGRQGWELSASVQGIAGDDDSPPVTLIFKRIWTRRVDARPRR